MKNGVEKNRKTITQEDCDIARFFTKRGMKMTEIAKMLQVDPSTISKMKAGDFLLYKYLEIRRESNRKDAERKAAQKKALADELMQKQAEEQVSGQIEMDLKAAEAKLNIPAEEKPEMSEQTKLMRFQAHQADRIVKKLDEILAELRRLNV